MNGFVPHPTGVAPHLKTHVLVEARPFLPGRKLMVRSRGLELRAKHAFRIEMVSRWLPGSKSKAVS
jgi:hypothetical protein